MGGRRRYVLPLFIRAATLTCSSAGGMYFKGAYIRRPASGGVHLQVKPVLMCVPWTSAAPFRPVSASHMRVHACVRPAHAKSRCRSRSRSRARPAPAPVRRASREPGITAPHEIALRSAPMPFPPSLRLFSFALICSTFFSSGRDCSTTADRSAPPLQR